MFKLRGLHISRFGGKGGGRWYQKCVCLLYVAIFFTLHAHGKGFYFVKIWGWLFSIYRNKSIEAENGNTIYVGRSNALYLKFLTMIYLSIYIYLLYSSPNVSNIFNDVYILIKMEILLDNGHWWGHFIVHRALWVIHTWVQRTNNVLHAYGGCTQFR